MTDQIEDFLAFLTASPTPYHAAFEVSRRLLDAGFTDAGPSAPDPAPAGGLDRAGRFATDRGVVRSGGALLAWALPPGERLSAVRIIGAHTDSPNLRVKPRPEREVEGIRQLAVEPYGGLLANSWLDRDLGLAGRVAVRTGRGSVVERLFHDPRPTLRVPQLAIHLDRDVAEKGLVLNRQQHLTPLWGLSQGPSEPFTEYLAEQAGVAADDVLAWDACCYDTAPPQLVGRTGEFLSASRLDNLCSCYGALTTALGFRPEGTIGLIIALFDHEEVGSESATGAASPLLGSLLASLCAARGLDATAVHGLTERSRLLSADMAHGTHPNYPERHEPGHHVRLGGGPVVKTNANQRYATEPRTAGEFMAACAGSDVPTQMYAHRADLACGSTIGPISAARLGIATVDVGMALLGMHSIRELMAVDDVAAMVAAFGAWAAWGDA